jgi:hypothetical protein
LSFKFITKKWRNEIKGYDMDPLLLEDLAGKDAVETAGIKDQAGRGIW